jgi:hypothetical protein
MVDVKLGSAYNNESSKMNMFYSYAAHVLRDEL